MAWARANLNVDAEAQRRSGLCTARSAHTAGTSLLGAMGCAGRGRLRASQAQRRPLGPDSASRRIGIEVAVPWRTSPRFRKMARKFALKAEIIVRRMELADLDLGEHPSRRHGATRRISPRWFEAGDVLIVRNREDLGILKHTMRSLVLPAARLSPPWPSRSACWMQTARIQFSARTKRPNREKFGRHWTKPSEVCLTPRTSRTRIAGVSSAPCARRTRS